MSTIPESPSILGRYVPIAAWLPDYPREWLRIDLIAGLTAASVVIPQAMAYAAIAGLPVQVGLYTALVPMIIYAFFGTSRTLSVSSTSTISILVATELIAVNGSNTADYLVTAVSLAALVGLFMILASFLRLGFIANFISLPVLTGFKAGIGVIIFVGQLSKVLGLDIPRGPVPATLAAVFTNLDQIHWATFAVSMVTLAILLLLPRVAPRIPAPLVAVAVGITASVLLGLEARGVAVIGDVPAGLPTLSLPQPALFGQLWLGAAGIALLNFVESIATARIFVHTYDPPVDPDQELLALGLANLGGSFFQGYPAGGGTSQTAVANKAGAKSQLAGLVVAGAVVLTLLFLSDLIGQMPQATLGAMVLVVASGLINIQEFRDIARIHRVELGWALIAFTCAVFLGTLEGIIAAVIASLASLLYYANHHEVYELGRKQDTDIYRPLRAHPDDETFPGLLILRTEGLLYFANADRVVERASGLLRDRPVRLIIFDGSAVPDFEYTAVHTFQVTFNKLAAEGTAVWLAALNPGALRTLEHAGGTTGLPDDILYATVETAVNAYLARANNLAAEQKPTMPLS
jgi:high affinity sulfate transporter 1